MPSRTSTEYALWDVLKFCGDYYFVTYNPNDERNEIILAPGGGPTPPSVKNHKLASIMKFIPPHRIIPMVKNFLPVFGHVGPKEHCDDSPQPCSMADFNDIKNRISYYNVD